MLITHIMAAMSAGADNKKRWGIKHLYEYARLLIVDGHWPRKYHYVYGKSNKVQLFLGKGVVLI